MDEIDDQQIKRLAFDVSKLHKTYNQLVWRLAEAELLLQSGVEPSHDKIRQIAESISESNPNEEDLHWFLAEKILLVKKKWGKDLAP